MRAAALLLLLLCRALPVLAEEADPLASLQDGGTVTVTRLDKDFTMVLTDGRTLRLAEVELPRRPLSDPSSQPWPPADAARQALTPLLDGPLHLLTEPDASPDRWGRWPATLVTADGRWVQAELLRQGLARVFTTPDEHAAAAALLAAEAPARTARLGLWGERATALRRSDETPRLVDSWQVVEGVVSSVRAGRSAIYIDMGEDWRRSLGLRLSRRTASHLPGDVMAMQGRRLRVRGWIGKGIGPMMDIGHAEQMEAVDGWPPRAIPAAKETSNEHG